MLIMFKLHLIRPFPGNIIASLFLIYFFLPRIVVADVDASALQYIARRLLPNECQSIVNHENAEPFHAPLLAPLSRKSPFNGIDCFQKLVNWASNLRINRRDTYLVLANRLRRIGRNDLAAWFNEPSSKERPVTVETVEYESWDSKKESSRKLMSSSDPTISQINRFIYGSPQTKSIAGPYPEFHQKSIDSFPDARKLNRIHSLDSFKDRSLVMAEPGSEHSATSAPEHIAAGDIFATNTTKENDGRDSNPSQTASGKPVEDKKHDKLKFPKIFPHFSDEKTAPCLRVPLSTALVVIGTIMTLTCCCALLLRNRLAACFERLRGKKTKTKRLSVDEEQGFMGPRTFGKVPKRSGTKGGGPTDMTNIGVQNSNNASNESRESDEKPTGCCNCCTRKKKKNRRKRKK